MTYEYLAIQRFSMHTSLHEQGLDEFLNKYAKGGWRLKQVIVQTMTHQLVIFEREAESKPS